MNKAMFKRMLQPLVYMVCLSIIMLYVFFYVALPYITPQGKIVEVLDLTGVHFKALNEKLRKGHLRFIIKENNGYSAQLPPFTALQHFYEAAVWLKENRKIYLTLNAENPPLVSVPNLK